MASPGPVVNQLDDTARDTFATGRPLEDSPELQQCKHCKKSVIKTAAKAHIAACLKVKKEKAQRKKEAREARERAKEAEKGEEKKKDDDDSDEEEPPAKPVKGAGKKPEDAKGAGKKRKADADAGGPKKKKKEEAKPKVPKLKGKMHRICDDLRSLFANNVQGLSMWKDSAVLCCLTASLAHVA